MIKTIKLYDNDAYAKSFEANIVSCEKLDNEKYAVVLDQTLFFPEEGGQTCDKGSICGVTVTDVKIRDGIITHFTKTPLETGKVVGEIDFDHRFRNMQNHSGEHIVSGLILSEFGFNNVGFHLGSSEMTMDYDGFLDDKMLSHIEVLANKAVYSNVQIIAKYPEKSELEATSYRSKLSFYENVRIVEIEGIDICACCAPHVRTTGEIGIIKFIYAEKYKGGTRIHAHCGLDALLDYQTINSDLARLCSLYSAKRHEAVARAQKQSCELLQLKAQNEHLVAELCAQLGKTIPSNGGIPFVFKAGIGAVGMKAIANSALEILPTVAVFDDKGNDDFAFVLASQNANVKEILGKLNAAFSAKGGGTDRFVQGTIHGNADEISQWLLSYSFDM